MGEPARKKSGEHPAVREYRQNITSIGDEQLARLAILNRRVERLKARASGHPDPRREDDARDSVPVEHVEIDDAESTGDVR